MTGGSRPPALWRQMPLDFNLPVPKTKNSLWLFHCTQFECKPSALPHSGGHVGSWFGLWFDKLENHACAPETLQLTASIIIVVCKTIVTVRQLDSEQLNPFSITLQSLLSLFDLPPCLWELQDSYNHPIQALNQIGHIFRWPGEPRSIGQRLADDSGPAPERRLR